MWHDETDLPPGDTTRRLEEALAAGLSGAVLVVTPDIERSDVVRNVELPASLSLERDSGFTLAIASVIQSRGEPLQLDFGAPERLLGQPTGTLQRFKQYRLFEDDDVESLAQLMVLQRMAMHARLGRDPLVINLQTRGEPREPSTAPALWCGRGCPQPGTGLHRPTSGCQWQRFWLCCQSWWPSRGLRACSSFAGCRHLSVAFALGAALPLTSGWPLTVTDRSGDWGPEVDGAAMPLIDVERTLDQRRRILAVAIDLVPGPPPMDTFESHLAARTTSYAASLRISLGEDRMISAESAVATATELSRRVRNAAAKCHTNRVSLFLRVPFPLALHLGRMLNTLTVELFEWEDGAVPPVYVPTVTVASGRGASPITEIATGT